MCRKLVKSERYNMLEINGLGTPNVQISKTQSRKHLNNNFFFGNIGNSSKPLYNFCVSIT